MVGESKEKRAVAALTIFADRVVGSSVLLFSGALALAAFHKLVFETPQLLWLAHAVWLAAAGLSAAGILLVFFTRRRSGGLSRLERIWWWLDSHDSPRARWLDKICGLGRKGLELLFVYRSRPAALALAATASASALSATIALYILLGNSLSAGIEPARLWLVVPIASLAGYFSFLPLGLGVGQVVYYQLFRWVGVAHPEAGATLCTLTQLFSLLVSLAGGLAFLRGGRPGKEARHADELQRAG